MTSYEPQHPPASGNVDKPLINLLRGWPHPALLPADIIKAAANAALSDPSVWTPGLLYGPDPGYEPVRESIAQWLSGFYQHDVTAERICITGGASQNLGCILNVYTDPAYTRCIWIVAPAYFLAFRIFEDAGFAVDGKMRAVPEDEHGVDITYLRQEIEKVNKKAEEQNLSSPPYKPYRQRAKIYKHVIYCVPTFANPSSHTMDLGRRKELVELARKFDALIVADDVYDFLQWPADTTTPQSETMKSAHLPRLVDIDRTLPGSKEGDGFGHTCSNGSFSKIAGPGIRVGWLEGSTKFTYGVSQAGTTCSGGAPSQLTSTYIDHMLRAGALQTHIQKSLLPAYSRRYRTLVSAIEQFLVPLGFGLPWGKEGMRVQGGFFTWLSLPKSLARSAEALAKNCQSEENVIIAPGSIFEVPGDERVKFAGNIRLCWSWEDEDRLAEGVERIVRVAKHMIRESERLGGEYVVVQKDLSSSDGAVVAEYK